MWYNKVEKFVAIAVREYFTSTEERKWVQKYVLLEFWVTPQYYVACIGIWVLGLQTTMQNT